MFNRPWAFWRRVEYITGLSLFVVLITIGTYFVFFWSPSNCFDGFQNGAERGVDCGGACNRVCAFDIEEPVVVWADVFPISRGLYNAVAYVENKNIGVGAVDVWYRFTVYDQKDKVITEKSGITFLPPDSVYPIFEPRLDMGIETPARTELVITAVDRWEKMEYGREQFLVQSRTLKSVDESPRLEATLYNSALSDSRDVEAVATIFDSMGNPLTASRTVIPLFEARTEKQVVFTWPEPIAKTIRSCEVPTDVMLLIDLSGSMNNDGGTPVQPITATLEAARSFVSRLKSQDQGGVVTFATGAELVGQLSKAITSVADKVGQLSIDPKEETGSTNIGDPLILATQELSSARHNEDARKVVVLLTDGLANAPVTATAETYAQDAATAAKEAGINIFTIGLGSSVNKTFLTSLASAPEQAYFAANISTLDQVYRTISTAICEDGPAVIDIIPKAPMVP